MLPPPWMIVRGKYMRGERRRRAQQPPRILPSALASTNADGGDQANEFVTRSCSTCKLAAAARRQENHYAV